MDLHRSCFVMGQREILGKKSEEIQRQVIVEKSFWFIAMHPKVCGTILAILVEFYTPVKYDFHKPKWFEAELAVMKKKSTELCLIFRWDDVSPIISRLSYLVRQIECCIFRQKEPTERERKREGAKTKQSYERITTWPRNSRNPCRLITKPKTKTSNWLLRSTAESPIYH